MVAPCRSSPGPEPSAAGNEVVRRLAGLLLTDLESVTGRLVAEIRADAAAYDGAAVPLTDLISSCHDNLARVLGTLEGSAPPGEARLDAPYETGRRRAEQGIPLESVLHAYRLGGRVVWQGMVALTRSGAVGSPDGLLDAATSVWEVVDTFSAAVAQAYRAEELLLVRRDEQRRRLLVDRLLGGRNPTEAATALGLPATGRFLVVIATAEPAEAGAPLAGGRAPDPLPRAQQALAARRLVSAWRTDTETEVGVVALGACTGPGAGKTTPGDVAAMLAPLATSAAIVSPAVDSLADIPRAHRLAESVRVALNPAAARVACADDLLAEALLAAAPELAGRLREVVLGPVLALPSADRDVLLATLRVYLDCAGSAGEAAQRLYCHRNTVLNRLRRVESLTGRDVDRPRDLTDLDLALRASRAPT